MTPDLWMTISVAFVGLVMAVIGSLALIIFARISADLAALIISVSELNVKIAVVVSRVDSHETRLNKIEERHE